MVVKDLLYQPELNGLEYIILLHPANRMFSPSLIDVKFLFEILLKIWNFSHCGMIEKI